MQPATQNCSGHGYRLVLPQVPLIFAASRGFSAKCSRQYYRANILHSTFRSRCMAAELEAVQDATAPQAFGIPDSLVVEDIKGIEASFLVPGQKTVGFVLGRGSERKHVLETKHQINITASPQNNKYLRTLKVKATSAHVIAQFWEDVLTMAEQGNRVILDTVADGTSYRLKMKIPKSLCGHLLGPQGQHLKDIQRRAGCLLKLQARNDTDSADSSFRILQLAGNHADLIAAIREVLEHLSTDERYQRVIPTTGYITVPGERVADVEELLPEIWERNPDLVKVAWVDPPKSIAEQGAKRLLLVGPPTSAAVAKAQLGSLWGKPDWSRRDWPGVFRKQ